MIDFGFDKIALIGAVALIVIGPEKLPRVARTVGHLLGKAQRYVADVKAEVNRSIELEELQKVKTQFETAAQSMEQSFRDEVSEVSAGVESSWNDGAGSTPSGTGTATAVGQRAAFASDSLLQPVPEYKRPDKNWRLKRGALPHWYKQRQGVRAKALSGAARVARFRPPGLK
jgi:sec-independent protein translocase protein TatB